MANETSYTNARANLAALCDQVVASREPLIIHRRGDPQCRVLRTLSERRAVDWPAALDHWRTAVACLVAIDGLIPG